MSLYTVLKSYLEDQVFIPAYNSLEWLPGPARREDVVETFDPVIVLTIGGGPGFELEQTFDRVMVYTECIGPSTDYDAAEELARNLDRALTAIERPVTLDDNTRVLSCIRSGGGPANIAQDDAQRWHFGCAYVLRVGSTH